MRAAVVLLVICFVALGTAPAQAQRGQTSTGAVSAKTGTGLQSPGAVDLQSLSSDEAGWLLYMWEEEILAKELYEAFYAEWQLPIFDKIAASEARHVAAVRTLVDRYGLTPEKEPGGGVFPNLQVLYDSLLAQGKSSVQGALEAGVSVEEADIADLTLAMKESDQKDILRVYANLLAASYNHLAAFTKELDVELLFAGESR